MRITPRTITEAQTYNHCTGTPFSSSGGIGTRFIVQLCSRVSQVDLKTVLEFDLSPALHAKPQAQAVLHRQARAARHGDIRRIF